MKDLSKYNVRFADSFIKKAIGLMFFPKKKDFILIFVNKKERRDIIHTFFCEPLYLYFLDKDKKVVEKTFLKPFRVYLPKHKFKYLIESFEDLKLNIGEKINFY